jgi:hypothetical protein
MSSDVVSLAAQVSGVTPVVIIMKAIREQHFSNEAEVIAQNIGRYADPRKGMMPDYVTDFARSIIKQAA